MTDSKFSRRNVVGVPNYEVTEFRPKSNKMALVIPIINERDNIFPQLNRIREMGSKVDIIIADGGSNDGTLEKFSFEEHGLTTLLVKEGNGKLSAQIRMAFHYCVQKNYDAVITIDGNGKDDVSGIAKVQDALLNGFDFVQGSRFVRGGNSENTPLLRYLAIRFLHAPLTSLGARHWFTDTTNGFRGHSIQLVINPQVNLFRDIFSSYELITYLPIRAGRLKLNICEVPVIRRYPRIGAIPTKIRGLRGYFELFRILIFALLGKYNPK